jgi:hypothetical protein
MSILYTRVFWLPKRLINYSAVSIFEETNKNFAISLQKLKKIGTSKIFNFFPGGLKSFWFHHRVQECRFYMHEFFGLSKWLFNYLAGSFILKITKVHTFRRPPWTYLDRISENGFQIRIQRIEIGGNRFDNTAAPRFADIHTDWRTLRNMLS